MFVQIYAQARDQLEGDGQDIPHQVFILRGGFQDFQAKYREDPELVENWSKEVWGNPEYFELTYVAFVRVCVPNNCRRATRALQGWRVIGSGQAYMYSDRRIE